MTTTVNTINGTEGNNRLTGTSGNDVINGNGGNDRINGGSGSDTLNGGAGKDELNGGSGNDVLDGGSGSDELEGGSGNDTLIYTLAENNVIGKFTYDEYEGGSGTDTLELRFTRSEWMNTSYQAVLQRYIDWANRSGSSCRWDDDFTFRFGNARLEIEDIEKLVVKVDGTTIENLGINTVDAVDDSDIKISEDSTGKEIYVLDNDKANYLVNDLILKTGPANGSVTLFKVDSNDPSSWYFKYSPNNDYYNYLNIGLTATDSFEYTVTDAKGKQDTATVTVTIEGENDAAIFIGTTEGTLTERGSINNSVSTVVSRTLTVTDVDNITTPTNSFIAIASGESTYGTYSINSSGRWTYVLDNTNPLVNKLNSGGALTDKFEVYSFDGTPQEITITINGSNDDAVIGDLPSNQLTEDSNNTPLLGQIYLSDSLSISDVDNRPLFIQGKTLSQINGGFFNLQSDGKYIYQIENSEIQYLSHGQELTESFTLTAEDGTQKTISFTITGVNDAAEIVAPDEIQVTEDQGVGLDGFITITGGISIADYDNGEASFKTEILSFPDNKGTLILNTNGSYTYSVNNADLQSLNAGDHPNDVFTIYAKDGTEKAIVITINGADDVVNSAPVVKEIGQGEIKYAGSANVAELINLDHFTSDPTTAINTNPNYEAKYDFDHVRKGQFLVSDVDVGDELTVSNTSTNPNEKIGNLETEILQAKDSEGDPIGGKYVVNWTYTVKDSELDPLNATTDGKPTKDQKFTVTIGDGTTSVDTEVVLHLFGRNEITFSDDDPGNNVFVGTAGPEIKNSNPGNDILYLGGGPDRATASNGSDVIYREGTASQLSDSPFSLNDGSPVFFGDYSKDRVTIAREVKDGIIFTGDGDDIITIFAPSSRPSNLGNANYVWGGEGSDLFVQASITNYSDPVPHWFMDFDSRNPSFGGDKIQFQIQGIIQKWNINTTKLEEKYADSNHPFLSEGATYYELRTISPFGSSPALNLVGTDGTEITLDGLFANQNLV